MLTPEMQKLLDALIALKDHESPTEAIIEDEHGTRLHIAKAYVVGLLTDDPGLVIRLRSLDRHGRDVLGARPLPGDMTQRFCAACGSFDPAVRNYPGGFPCDDPGQFHGPTARGANTPRP
jgi:hypothetical protein